MSTSTFLAPGSPGQLPAICRCTRPSRPEKARMLGSAPSSGRPRLRSLTAAKKACVFAVRYASSQSEHNAFSRSASDWEPRGRVRRAVLRRGTRRSRGTWSSARGFAAGAARRWSRRASCPRVKRVKRGLPLDGPRLEAPKPLRLHYI